MVGDSRRDVFHNGTITGDAQSPSAPPFPHFIKQLKNKDSLFLSLNLCLSLCISSVLMSITSFPLPTQDDDFSYFYSLFPSPLSEMSNDNNGTSNKRPRNDGSGDGDDWGGDAKKYKRGSKKKDLKEILASILLLEEQEKSDREQWAQESQQEKSLFDANHRQMTQAMMDYSSHLQEYYSDLEEFDQMQLKRSRLSASAAAAAAVSAKTNPDASSMQPTSGGGAGGGGGGAAGHQRRLWVKDRSKAWWDKCNHPDFPEEEFRKAFRMGRATFDMICEELNSVVAKEDTMLRAAIPVRQRVAVCIWRLATGEPLRLVSKRFGLGISTCHKLVLEVCSAIKSVLMPKFLQWPDEEALKRTKDEFESMSGIPNVVGSMYTTHIPIIAPKISVAAYFNKRHTERNQKTSYSITVQGVVDTRGIFTDICIGWPGSMSDDKVLENSALFQRANGGLLKGVWIVGSAGYPLMDWVLVPYTREHLTWTQHAFNEKIGDVQRVAKDAFARLKGRWSCLQKRSEVKLQELPAVLGACCVLHNICEIRNEHMDPDLTFELIDDEIIPENNLRSPSSMQARDNIAHNLLHHGLAGTTFL